MGWGGVGSACWALWHRTSVLPVSLLSSLSCAPGRRCVHSQDLGQCMQPRAGVRQLSQMRSCRPSCHACALWRGGAPLSPWSKRGRPQLCASRDEVTAAVAHSQGWRGLPCRAVLSCESSLLLLRRAPCRGPCLGLQGLGGQNAGFSRSPFPSWGPKALALVCHSFPSPQKKG